MPSAHVHLALNGDKTRKGAEPRGSWIPVEECRWYSVRNEEGVALEPGSDTLQLCWSVECFRGGRSAGPETRYDNGLTRNEAAGPERE